MECTTSKKTYTQSIHGAGNAAHQKHPSTTMPPGVTLYKKVSTAKATNESKHSETWIATGQFHARMSKNTRMLLNFTTALISSEFRATRTRGEYALGRLPGKRRAPGLPSRHPASLAPVLILRHHPLFTAVSTNFVVDLRFLWQECMSA